MKSTELFYDSVSNVNEIVKEVFGIFPDSFFDGNQEIKPVLYESVAEIICNINNHAYPDNFKSPHKYEFKVIINTNEDKLSISIIDYGATIPVTVLNKIGSSHLNDVQLINEAIKGAYSYNGRGVGLPQIVKQVQEGLLSEVAIISGSGCFKKSILSTKSQLFLNKDKLQGTNITLECFRENQENQLRDYTEIKLSEIFKECPFGRFRSDSNASGEALREDHLIPALQRFKTVTIDLDGHFGLSSSFLEEAFAGLVRRGFSEKELTGRLNIVLLKRPSVVHMVWRFIYLASSIND